MTIAERLGLTPLQKIEVESVQSQTSAINDVDARRFDELLVSLILAHAPATMGGPRTDAAIENSLSSAATQLARQLPGLLWPRRTVPGHPVLGPALIGQKHALVGSAVAGGHPAFGITNFQLLVSTLLADRWLAGAGHTGGGMNDGSLEFADVMRRVPAAKRHAFAQAVSRGLFEFAPFSVGSSVTYEELGTIINRVADRLGVSLR